MTEEQTPKEVMVSSTNAVHVELVYDPISGYAWDQEGLWVKVYVSLNEVGSIPRENITCSFEESSFNLAVVGYQRKNLRLYLQNLDSEIKIADSKIIVKKNMVIVKMKKEEDGKWSDLLQKKQASGDDEEKKGGMGGMPGMGGMGGMPGMGGMGGMPGMGGMGGMPGMGGMGGMPGMGGMGGMPGMEGLGGMGGMGGMPGMEGMGGMGGMPGMEGMGGMPGMEGMGGMPGMEGMGGMPGMPGMPGMGGKGKEGDGKNPQEDLMGMMKKMYEEGDDDMKRTINEAWSKAQNGKEGGPPAPTEE